MLKLMTIMYRIIGTLIVAMSVSTCGPGPDINNSGCADVPTDPGIPSVNLAVVDWCAAHGGRVLLNYGFSTVFIVADDARQLGIDTIDLRKTAPLGKEIVYNRGCFFGSSGDTLAFSYFIITASNDTLTRLAFYAIETATLTEVMPARCMANGWDPIANEWFYATGFDRRDGKERMRLRFGRRFDLRDLRFVDKELSDPYGMISTEYAVTDISSIAIGVTARQNADLVWEYALYTSSTILDLSDTFENIVFSTTAIPGTDYLAITARSWDGVYSDQRAHRHQIFIVDAAMIARGSSFRDAIVQRYNLLQLNCMIAQHGYQVRASNGKEIFASMHRVGDPMQLPYALTIDSPVRIRPVFH